MYTDRKPTNYLTHSVHAHKVVTTFIRWTIKRLTSNCSLSFCKRNKKIRTMSCKLLYMLSDKNTNGSVSDGNVLMD